MRAQRSFPKRIVLALEFDDGHVDVTDLNTVIELTLDQEVSFSDALVHVITIRGVGTNFRSTDINSLIDFLSTNRSTTPRPGLPAATFELGPGS